MKVLNLTQYFHLPPVQYCLSKHKDGKMHTSEKKNTHHDDYFFYSRIDKQNEYNFVSNIKILKSVMDEVVLWSCRVKAISCFVVISDHAKCCSR